MGTRLIALITMETMNRATFVGLRDPYREKIGANGSRLRPDLAACQPRVAPRPSAECGLPPVPGDCAISSSPLLSPVDHVTQPLKLLVELGLQMSQSDRMPSHSHRLNKSEHVKMQLVGAGKESSILQFSADTVTPTSEIGFPRRNGLGC